MSGCRSIAAKGAVLLPLHGAMQGSPVPTALPLNPEFPA